MKKVLIPAVLIGVLMSSSAFAHREWDDEEGYRPYRPHHETIYQAAPLVVYQAPRVVYAPPPPPQVVYRERVVYRDVPTYGYQQPASTYYQQQSEYPAPTYQYGNRVAGQAIGAIAGGVIGNQIGRGGGRVVSTAVGAVLGAIAGDRIAY